MASGFSLIAIIMYGIDGRWIDSYGVTLAEVIVLYFTCGIVGGLVVGVAWPLTRWQEGAALVGAMAATPVYLGVAVLDGRPLSDPWNLWMGIAAAIVVGGACGYRLWKPGSREAHPPRN